MSTLLMYFVSTVPLCIGAMIVGENTYRLDFVNGSSRAATEAEILVATKAKKIDAINDECRKRLIARFGTGEEQGSRWAGIYGQAERTAQELGVAGTVDASNAATDVVLGSTTIAQVEAVTVAWPVI